LLVQSFLNSKNPRTVGLKKTFHLAQFVSKSSH